MVKAARREVRGFLIAIINQKEKDMKKSFELLKMQLMMQVRSNYDCSYDFDKFYRTFCREFKKIAVSLGCTDVKLSKGFFSLSGFFTCSNGKVVYISLEDWRWNTMFLIRTAENYKDFHGGINHFITIKSGSEMFISGLKNFLRVQCMASC